MSLPPFCSAFFFFLPSSALKHWFSIVAFFDTGTQFGIQALEDCVYYRQFETFKIALEWRLTIATSLGVWGGNVDVAGTLPACHT